MVVLVGQRDLRQDSVRLSLQTRRVFVCECVCMRMSVCLCENECVCVCIFDCKFRRPGLKWSLFGNCSACKLYRVTHLVVLQRMPCPGHGVGLPLCSLYVWVFSCVFCHVCVWFCSLVCVCAFKIVLCVFVPSSQHVGQYDGVVVKFTINKCVFVLNAHFWPYSTPSMCVCVLACVNMCACSVAAVPIHAWPAGGMSPSRTLPRKVVWSVMLISVSSYTMRMEMRWRARSRLTPAV